MKNKWLLLLLGNSLALGFGASFYWQFANEIAPQSEVRLNSGHTINLSHLEANSREVAERTAPLNRYVATFPAGVPGTSGLDTGAPESELIELALSDAGHSAQTDITYYNASDLPTQADLAGLSSEQRVFVLETAELIQREKRQWHASGYSRVDVDEQKTQSVSLSMDDENIIKEKLLGRNAEEADETGVMIDIPQGHENWEDFWKAQGQGVVQP